MTANDSPLIQRLWNQWLEYHDQSAANQLIDHYMYLVSFQVERISSHLPNNVDKEDIKSFGLMGLYDALTKFEQHRDLKFDTYASFRIRGTIIDGLRKEDWLPRSIREKTKKIERASQQLEQIYEREATSEEIGEELQMSAKEVEEHTRDSLVANILSIEEKPGNNHELQEGIGYTIPDESSVRPDDYMLNSELKSELMTGIQSLNQNEQMVISLFYHEELTLTEIGLVLELTTSRISQIHRKALFRLRKSLQKIQS